MSRTTSVPKAIRDFVEAHKEGWSHDEWLGLLHHLGETGFDVSDPDGIGLALEQERIRAVLQRSGVKGLGPKRIEAVSTGYGDLHQLRSVDASHIAGTAGIPLKLAQELEKALR